MKVVIVGSGYVGLITGVCFSEIGIDVACVDINSNKIDNLNKGIISIYEPSLKEMITRNMKKRRLNFTTNIEEALQYSKVLFISVGTPADEDGSADLKYVLTVARDSRKHLNDHMLVVTENAVPVGTFQKGKRAMQEELDKRNIKIEFDAAPNPEFLNEGAAIDDFLKPDRIVVRLESERAEGLIKSLDRPFTLNSLPIIFMDILSAEMTKYAATSILAAKISFIDDIANLYELVGVDINKVREGIGSDSPIGHKFIHPRIRYDSFCFPKVVQSLLKIASERNNELRAHKAVKAVNIDQKLVFFNKVINYFKGDVKGATTALWGLSFKLKTDDMREALLLYIVKNLLEAGAIVKRYDPIAINKAKHQVGSTILYCKDLYEKLIDANSLTIFTEWLEFKIPNFKILRKLFSTPAIFDFRNIYDKYEMKESGFNYFSIGIATSKNLINY